MIQSLKNIDTAFKHIRLFTFILILAFSMVTCYINYNSLMLVRSEKKNIWILHNGKALPATAASADENLEVELRDHIRTFHELFFNLLPDDAVNQANIKRGLYLCDKSAMDQYTNLREAGYYTQVVNANISQSITMDSIVLNLNTVPYSWKYYGKLSINRSTSYTKRLVVTEGRVQQLRSRTDNNSHGMLIQGWTILQNADIENVKK